MEGLIHRQVHYVFIYILCIFVPVSTGQKTFTDVKTALETVVGDFELATSLRPVANLADVLTVNLDLNIAAVNDFNEQNGYIEISGYLNMEWTMTQGRPTPEADSYEEMVGNTYIWKPPLIMVNAIKKAEEIGWETNVDIRYNFNTLHCSWRPWIIARAACTPDVKYYPFDKQSCSFKFAAWGYNSSELLITANTSKISFNFFEENGEWKLGDTSTLSYVENDVSVVEYNLKLTRRPTYYVINLIAPIILLAVLNVFVFILPPASGERIGYSVTCFLAYVVLLNTVMAFLPTSAAPLAYLSYYTFVMMCFSAGMSLATILTLRIHFKPKDGKVSPSVKAFLDCICCKWLTSTDVEPRKSAPAQIQPEPKWADLNGKVPSSWDEDEIEDVEIVDQTSGSRSDTSRPDTSRTESSSSRATSRDEEDHTWEKLASYLDKFFFLGFLGGQIFYSVAYLVPIIVNA